MTDQESLSLSLVEQEEEERFKEQAGLDPKSARYTVSVDPAKEGSDYTVTGRFPSKSKPRLQQIPVKNDRKKR
jgi:hypothetical protein